MIPSASLAPRGASSRNIRTCNHLHRRCGLDERAAVGVGGGGGGGGGVAFTNKTVSVLYVDQVRCSTAQLQWNSTAVYTDKAASATTSHHTQTSWTNVYI